MTLGKSVATVQGQMQAMFEQTAYVETALWAQLHTGDPGADGTANIATEDTRIDATACFIGGNTGNTQTNTVEIGPWTSVAATETYAYITLWQASTGSTGFICSGMISAAGVTAGDDFSIPIGDCTATEPVAA